MADIRIKDLTTTASSTASDDFIAVDGTTNGTRKLSAFSPTFGGNATVTGTLTVSGNTTLSGNLDVASGISTGIAQLQIGNGRTGSGYAYVDLVGDTTYSDYGFRIIRNNGGANTSSELAHRGTGDFALVANDAAPIKFYTNGVTAATIAATTGNTTIHSTSASTSTSSGALVVGNGTQGGLGVGGAITCGGGVTATGTVYSAAALSTDGGLSANSGDITGGYIILRGFGNQDGGVLFLGQSANNNYVSSNATTIGITIGNVGIASAVAAGFRVLTSTASTSTSSGALVVSGGVGVAGKVNAGSFTTTGHTTSAVENVNVSTTAVDIAIATSVGAIYFVSGYNNSNGAQGTWLLMVRGTNVTTVSSDNNTGLTVTFSLSSGKLQAATASGTLVTNAYAITR